jgi:pimeloyl-ACP methyl ester carboxylesterase
MTEAAEGKLRPAGGIEMYVEVEGEGPDVVLLHGGGGTADDLAGLRAALRAGRRMIVPDQRAHGRTPDVGELRYVPMATDTAALLDGMGVRAADLVGWSDGGIIALIVARDRPDLVRHVVAIGANVDSVDAPDAMSPETTSWFAGASPADLDFDMSDESKTRLLAMWHAGPEITVADLARVTPPVLLISGDRDIVTLEHTLAMYHALPDAQLAVIPGSNHHVPQSRHETVAAIVVEFLEGRATDQPGA